MSTQDIVSMLPELERIARQAGELVRAGYRTGARISKKGAFDLVTEFDLRSEAFILKELSGLYPAIDIVGEEGQGKQAVAAGDPNRLRFFVDPIDGTTNFAHGHPYFCVSIGLCKGTVPVAGVVYAPILDVCWVGAVGAGMVRNGDASSVSHCDTLSEALCATGFGYEVAGKVDDNVPEFQGVQARAQGMRRCGAAALDLTMIADGTYDAYWEFMLQPWDLAGGAALVLAAGGTALGFDGQPLNVLEGAVVASSTPSLNAQLRDTIRGVRNGRPVPTR
jgi:myo-inositol-1(or 4)-monophosphatase